MSYLLLIALFILIAGIFAASETALFSARKSRIKELADNGSQLAKIVQDFQKKSEEILATVKVGFILSLSLSSILAGLYALNEVSPFFATSDSSFVADFHLQFAIVLVVFCYSLVAIAVGELVPKSLTLHWPEHVALVVVVPLRLLSFIFRPVSSLVRALSNLILRPFSDRTSFSEARLSEEELKFLLEESTRSGVISRAEHELISSIFEFTDTSAKEVMIPRTDVVAVSADAPREKLLRIVVEEGYSRLPVYRGTIDNIIGIVYTKDLISLLEHRDLIILSDIIRPAYFVPENKKISRLMRELQEKKLHLAIVIDEFGGTEGIITMEDIIEEIVGEIHDEYDEVVKEFESSSDGSTLVNGRVSIEDFNKRIGAALPDDDAYETLSGFLCKITGRIPEQGEEIPYDGLTFSIVRKSHRRIRQVRVRKTNVPAAGKNETPRRIP